MATVEHSLIFRARARAQLSAVLVMALSDFSITITSAISLITTTNGKNKYRR